MQALECDPSVETETGFGSSFSETMLSVYKTKASYWYLVKLSPILASPVSLAKQRKFEK